MALVVAKCLHEMSLDSDRVVFLSAGTDGIDGPTEAAGAVVDHTTLEGTKAGLDCDAHLANNDSHSYFQRLDKGNLIHIGHSGTNVMDLQMLWISQATSTF